MLILHQRAHPGRRLTLKCPHHLAWLPALAEALPEAVLVQTHRNPVEVVPSECKLILSLHGVSVRELDWRRSVESNHFKVPSFAADNRQHKHGKNSYSLDEFGLDETKINREFAAYRERFLHG